MSVDTISSPSDNTVEIDDNLSITGNLSFTGTNSQIIGLDTLLGLDSLSFKYGFQVGLLDLGFGFIRVGGQDDYSIQIVVDESSEDLIITIFDDLVGISTLGTVDSPIRSSLITQYIIRDYAVYVAHT